MKRFFCLLIILALVTVACGAPAPAPTPTLTPTPTAKADPEREAIINFTRQALAIEAGRDELMSYFASVTPGGGRKWLMSRFYLKGVTAGKWSPDPGRDLEGMASLQTKLLLLDGPQSLQAIKDSLSYIYASEIELFYWEQAEDALDAYFNSYEPWKAPGYSSRPQPLFSLGRRGGISLTVTYNNLDEWKQKFAESPPGSILSSSYSHTIDSTWFKLQSFRRDVYIRWSQILKGHGIDPAKEGFTALVLQ